MTDSVDAAGALAAMRTSQARLAKAASCPPERHLAFAGLMGVYVSAPAAPFWLMLTLEALMLVCVVFVIRWDRRRTGVFINGYQRGKTRWVMAVMLPGMLALYITGYWMAKARGVWWVPWRWPPSP